MGAIIFQEVVRVVVGGAMVRTRIKKALRKCEFWFSLGNDPTESRNFTRIQIQHVRKCPDMDRNVTRIVTRESERQGLILCPPRDLVFPCSLIVFTCFELLL